MEHSFCLREALAKHCMSRNTTVMSCFLFTCMSKQFMSNTVDPFGQDWTKLYVFVLQCFRMKHCQSNCFSHTKDVRFRSSSRGLGVEGLKTLFHSRNFACRGSLRQLKGGQHSTHLCASGVCRRSWAQSHLRLVEFVLESSFLFAFL